jgi:hypothetical protein
MLYSASNLKCEHTFLWVALVCQEPREYPTGKNQKKLNSFPPGLDSLYERMMNQMCESEDSNSANSILASIATVFRPISLENLLLLLKCPRICLDDPESLSRDYWPLWFISDYSRTILSPSFISL